MNEGNMQALLHGRSRARKRFVLSISHNRPYFFGSLQIQFRISIFQTRFAKFYQIKSYIICKLSFTNVDGMIKSYHL